MTEDDDRLRELAGAIVAGAATDWALAESTAADESTRKIIAGLRVIARIAEVHGSERLAAEHPGAGTLHSSFTTEGQAPPQFWGTLRLVEKVGRGAYGEVYRAWDTRLDREVALKLLPSSLAAGDSRATTIIEEGRLLARVRHPNVVMIHGAERLDDRVGLWMEFIRGRTLEQLLEQRGTFAAADAVHVGVELCQALAAVHAAGLLHRDIKAHNVMVADDGRVVLMDFGAGREVGRTAGTDLAGTPLYLAPELLRKEEATVRSDVYSVGVLLYHLVTASYPVQANSLHDLRLAHDRRERQALNTIRPDLSPRLVRIIERATDPQPERRHDGASVLGADLAALNPRPRVVRLAYAAAMAAALAAGVAAFVWTNRADTAVARAVAPRTDVRVVPLPAMPGDKMFPTLSPDGSRVVFMWDRGQGHYLYVTDVGRDATVQLTRLSDKGGSYPAWSPDGRRIAFIRRTRVDQERTRHAVLIVPADGGVEDAVLSDPRLGIGLGLDWSPDGEHLVLPATATPGQPPRLLLVSVTSGERRWLAAPSQGSAGDSYPVFAPDGRSVAFVRGAERESGLYVLSLAGGEAKRLVSGASEIRRPAWAPDGETLIFTFVLGTNRNSLWRVSTRGGEPEPLAGTGEGAREPSAARFANRLVFTRALLDNNIYRADLTDRRAGSSTPLAATTRQDTQPHISPDGSRVAFVSDRTGHSEIWTVDSDGSNPRPVTGLKARSRFPRWSPDGQHIVFSAAPGASHFDIHVVDAQGGSPRRLTFDASNEQWPTWSADGRWIYYGSDRSGRWEIWTVPARGGPAAQVTTSGGLIVQESFDGRFLFYSNNAPGVWRVRAGSGEPELLLRFPTGTHWGGEWALASGGIYWVDGNVSPRSAIEFFSFAAGTSRRAFTAPGILDNGGGFSVAPDGTWLAFTQRDYHGSDIMMIDGFR